MVAKKESSGNLKNWLIGVLVVAILVFVLFFKSEVLLSPPGKQWPVATIPELAEIDPLVQQLRDDLISHGTRVDSAVNKYSSCIEQFRDMRNKCPERGSTWSWRNSLKVQFAECKKLYDAISLVQPSCDSFIDRSSKLMDNVIAIMIKSGCKEPEYPYDETNQPGELCKNLGRYFKGYFGGHSLAENPIQYEKIRNFPDSLSSIYRLSCSDFYLKNPQDVLLYETDVRGFPLEKSGKDVRLSPSDGGPSDGGPSIEASTVSDDDYCTFSFDDIFVSEQDEDVVLIEGIEDQ